MAQMERVACFAATTRFCEIVHLSAFNIADTCKERLTQKLLRLHSVKTVRIFCADAYDNER